MCTRVPMWVFAYGAIANTRSMSMEAGGQGQVFFLQHFSHYLILKNLKNIFIYMFA